MTELTKLAVGFIVFAIVAATVITIILFVVGETVDHFTP
jgi:hypothetical protein